MPKLLPDQSFYPSPDDGHAGPGGDARLRGAAQPRPGTARRAGGARRRSCVARATAPDRAAWTCPTPATSCTTSGGTRAARACARTRRTRTCERRYLVVPGMRSSRIHILDTEPDPRAPAAREGDRGRGSACRRPATAARTPRTAGPDGIYINALGNAERRRPGRDLRARSRDLRDQGRWESDRGPQYLAYDFWWHLGHDTMITSEWGTPKMVEDGVIPGAAARRQVRQRAARLGSPQPASPAEAGSRHRAADGARAAARRTIPTETYGFVGVVTSLKDLSASIWMWHREGTQRAARGASAR